MSISNHLIIYIKHLPPPLNNIIFDYLWGTQIAYKKKLNIIHTLPKYKESALISPIFCYRGGIEYEIENYLYCPKCGEKNVFPVTRQRCWDCDRL